MLSRNCTRGRAILRSKQILACEQSLKPTAPTHETHPRIMIEHRERTSEADGPSDSLNASPFASIGFNA